MPQHSNRYVRQWATSSLSFVISYHGNLEFKTCLGMQLIDGISDPNYSHYDVIVLSKAKVITKNNNAE